MRKLIGGAGTHRATRLETRAALLSANLPQAEKVQVGGGLREEWRQAATVAAFTHLEDAWLP
jgi:hypothetical protein